MLDGGDQVAMKKYALVVGISRYADPEITDLGFAAQDAREVQNCLLETCRFDEARLLVSGGDKEPDHVNIVDALHNLAPLLSGEDLLLFYFAGHGIHQMPGRARYPWMPGLKMSFRVP